MPIYEFACPDCKHEEDRLVSMDTKTIRCASCGKNMCKVISAPHFTLNGFTEKNGYSMAKGVRHGSNG